MDHPVDSGNISSYFTDISATRLTALHTSLKIVRTWYIDTYRLVSVLSVGEREGKETAWTVIDFTVQSITDTRAPVTILLCNGPLPPSFIMT